MPPNKTTRMLQQSTQSFLEWNRTAKQYRQLQQQLDKIPEHIRRDIYAAIQHSITEAVSKAEAGQRATDVIQRHRQQKPQLDHAIKSPRHLEETVRRRTTLAGRRATNIIRTNIKSQRHITHAGRRQKWLTTLDDVVTQKNRCSYWVRSDACARRNYRYYQGRGTKDHESILLVPTTWESVCQFQQLIPPVTYFPKKGSEKVTRWRSTSISRFVLQSQWITSFPTKSRRSCRL